MSAMITDDFVHTYSSQTPPWGFNGMGEIVFLRTYSRKKENGDSETWTDTLQRVINGAIDIGVPYTQEEAERLFDHMFNLRCSFSGRSLWQLGTSLTKEFSGTSLNNCLSYETRVLTSDGVKEIGEIAGDTAIIMDGAGKWVEAEIRSFGEQELFKITMTRNRIEKTIYATKGHRWFTYGHSANEEWTTDVLPIGNYLVSIYGQGVASVRPSSFGIAHGIVFGDGTRNGVSSASGTKVLLCGEKNEALLEWFPNSPSRNVQRNEQHVGVEITDLPKAFKDKPSLNESKSYLYGWLAGYFAADGCVGESGQLIMSSSKRQNLEFVRDVCYRLGIGTHPIHSQNRLGIDGKHSDLHHITLMGEMFTKEFFLIIKHAERWVAKYGDTQGRTLPQHSKRAWQIVSVEPTDRVEEVYCAVVPTTNSFVLEDNLLTGNCYYTNIEKIEDFELLFDYLMLGGGVGFSVERSKIHDLPKVKSGVTVTHERTNDADIIVPDSRQGWRRLLHSVLKSYFETGRSFTYSTILVREYGAPLKKFGGTASGPGALIDGIVDICKVLENRVGKKLRSIDVLDICNIIGRIVVSGSSRRSAQIAIGDPDDVLFLRAKNWGSGNVPAWRANSNNSIYADGYDEIAAELWKGYDGTGEPYGLVNRKLARKFGRVGQLKPDPTIEGFNPCLTGDTRILLADGRGAVSIGELAESGNDVQVFTVDDSGSVVIRDMRAPRKTGSNVPVSLVTLDDGSSFRATSNHKMSLTNGTEVRVDELKMGDSITAVTRTQRRIQEVWGLNTLATTTQLYWWMTAPNKIGSFEAEHRIVAANFKNEKIPAGYVVHHMDYNALNNSPNNLLVMKKEDHDALHAKDMIGDGNPMRQEHSDEWWARYRKNMSIAVSGEKNGKYSGHTHEDIKVLALELTKKLARIPTLDEFQAACAEVGAPQSLSKWRKKHLNGGVSGLLRWAASIELGLDLLGEERDPRTSRNLQYLLSEGYDATYVDSQITFTKKCEYCDGTFTTKQRETGFCSSSCSNNKIFASGSYAAKERGRRTAASYENKHEVLRKQQVTTYISLQASLLRTPLKNEWVDACKKDGISFEVSRVSSPFRAWSDIQDAATGVNHKVVSVVSDGFADVYNGTVDDTHKYLIAAGNGVRDNGNLYETYVLSSNCGEIALGDGESCNLSTIFLPNIKSAEQFKDISYLLYKTQKQITRMNYPYEKTTKIVQKNSRLGQSITGILQCSEEQVSWLSDAYNYLEALDAQYSKENGLPVSVRLTTVQPSGTLSLLPGVTPGIHPAFAPYYIRRVRFGSSDPLVDACRKRGYKACYDVGIDGREDHTRFVVEFPCESPEGSVLASSMTAVAQLEWVKKMQTEWADNAVSVTVYYRKEELSEIKDWLSKNYDNSVKSVSFLLHADHNFPLPPYEECTKEAYEKSLNKIDFSIPLHRPAFDGLVELDDCATGGCPIK